MKLKRIFAWMLPVLLAAGVVWAGSVWNVDSSGNLTVGKSTVLLPVGGTSNCKLVLSDATTLAVVGSDGNALSATNPCVVKVNDATTLSFTSPVSSTFGATSDTDGNAFGITITVDWASAMPMFLHVCDGTAPYFAFSRNPARYSSGAAATDMCQEGDEDCDAQGDMFIMSSGLTLASEVNKSCVTVGSFQTTFSTTDDKWAVGTLVAGRDGFGKFQGGVQFTMPAGQNGAAAGKYFGDNGGTAPVFTTSVPQYSIGVSGVVDFMYYFNADGGTDGSGAQALNLTLPYAQIAPAGNQATERGNGKAYGQTTISSVVQTIPAIGSGTSVSGFTYGGSTITNAMFSAGDRYLRGWMVYPAF